MGQAGASIAAVYVVRVGGWRYLDYVRSKDAEDLDFIVDSSLALGNTIIKMKDELTIEDVPHCVACGRGIYSTETWYTIAGSTVCDECHYAMLSEVVDALTEDEMDDIDTHMEEMVRSRSTYIVVHDREDKRW